MGTENMTLKWDDFEKNAISSFKGLRDDDEFLDATIMCENSKVRAHRVILSACSPKFREMFRCSAHHSPVVYLSGVREADLVALLDFMYNGQVAVPEKNLEDFLKTAAELQVKGLSEVVGSEDINSAVEEDLQNLLSNRGGPNIKRMKLDHQEQMNSSSGTTTTTGLSLAMKLEPGLSANSEPRRGSSTQEQLRSSPALNSTHSALLTQSPAKQLPNSVSVSTISQPQNIVLPPPPPVSHHQAHFSSHNPGNQANFQSAQRVPQPPTPIQISNSSPYAVRLPIQQPGQPPQHRSPMVQTQQPRPGQQQQFQAPVQHQVNQRPQMLVTAGHPPVLHLPESSVQSVQHMINSLSTAQTSIPGVQQTGTGTATTLTQQQVEALLARHAQAQVNLGAQPTQGGASADQDIISTGGQQQVCTYCNREFKNLKQHLKRGACAAVAASQGRL